MGDHVVDEAEWLWEDHPEVGLSDGLRQRGLGRCAMSACRHSSIRVCQMCKAARVAASAAKAAVLERRWMFGPGYDRNGEAMAEAVAKAVRRSLLPDSKQDGAS